MSTFFILLIVGFFLVRIVSRNLDHPSDPTLDEKFPAVEPMDEPETVIPEKHEEPAPEPEQKPEPAPVVMPAKDRLFGLVGKPLGHSSSMVRFRKFFREQHISADYQNFEMDSVEGIRDFVAANPTLCGFNVTIPFKTDIIQYLDRLDETAAAIGAVNTVKVIRTDGRTELVGYNTDWIGFTQSVRPLAEGHSKALILGTGGAAKAVSYALGKLGIENRFVSRNSSFDVMGYYELSPSVMDDYDMVVNCTPVGMWPDVSQRPDIPYSFLSDRHLLFDVIANPEETQFMAKGKQYGATVKGGKEMLELQANAAWKIWNE